ncbi:imidazolonepropionase [Thermoflexibacter ruber]|uniref:Imidazolonepropionase n=1 Tax=Thermoflexibacter ruber TaxID=1003 RepID=A0A1I2JBQ0_9BACT|nr:imidazolonepropionase [Thermoflexibacter ruber]SFF51749.1 imidazolonepropionase [Thermoflexibacter ruber]
MKIIGSFKQILPLTYLPYKGAVKDEQLQVIENGAVVVDKEVIVAVGTFEQVRREFPEAEIEEIENTCVLLPSFIDCHTHTCFAGSRANDFAARNAGKSYLEIAQAGGGIWSTVQQTRQASENDLVQLTRQRVEQFLKEGITTIEIKSGYGLDKENELKMLRAIKKVQAQTQAQIISTCLAAHIKPKDFQGDNKAYLKEVLHDFLPQIKKENLCQRVDIFIEKTAFNAEESEWFLLEAKQMGFDLTIHADQFTPMGAEVAVKVGAVSADHLEASTDSQIELLAKSNTVAVVLAGASMGLGEPFAPARQLLDAGACLAIASDFNPGSAPMGKLLLQASVLACYQKLSTAEVLAGLTFRAAKALNINHIGKIAVGYRADLQAYPCADYREILYQQGRLLPQYVWKSGKCIFPDSAPQRKK